MLVKLILIFLLSMVILGMIGKAVYSGVFGKPTGRPKRFCADCGRPLNGGRCTCGAKQ